MTSLAIEALTGSLERRLRNEARGIERGAKEAVERTTRSLQIAVRGEVNRIFPGRGRGRAGNAIRSRVYPREGGGFTGLIWSKLGRREGGQFVDYLLPFVKGATLAPKGGKYLVIPVKGTSRRVKRYLRDLARLGEDPKLALIPGRGGKLYFVRRTRTRTTLIAILVRRVRIPAKLKLEGHVAAAERALPEALLQELERASPAAEGSA